MVKRTHEDNVVIRHKTNSELKSDIFHLSRDKRNLVIALIFTNLIWLVSVLIRWN